MVRNLTCNISRIFRAKNIASIIGILNAQIMEIIGLTFANHFIYFTYNSLIRVVTEKMAPSFSRIKFENTG